LHGMKTLKKKAGRSGRGVRRSKFINLVSGVGKISKNALLELVALNKYNYMLLEKEGFECQRPRTRGACGEERPCPWVGCRFHLYMDVTGTTIKYNLPEIPIEKTKYSCALDIADGGERSLEFIGALMSLTRERVRQIEKNALDKLKKAVEAEMAAKAALGGASPQIGVRRRLDGKDEELLYPVSMIDWAAHRFADQGPETGRKFLGYRALVTARRHEEKE
jgi:hypothetical protein